LLHHVYNNEVVEMLNRAFDQTSYWDFFSSIGTVNQPLVINGFYSSNERTIIEFSGIPKGFKNPIVLRSSASYYPIGEVPPSKFEKLLLAVKDKSFDIGIALFILYFIVVAVLEAYKKPTEWTVNFFIILFIVDVLVWLITKILVNILY
jgi:hypothetical protein